MSRYDDLKWEREQLGFEEDRWLRECGWSTTSDTPGCFVLWEREYKGKTLLVSRSTALEMQRHFDVECIACTDETE